MYKRLNNLIKSNSFFLFGARGTGKSTLVRDIFKHESLLEIDLLDPIQAEEALLSIGDMKARIEYAVSEGRWVFIDEVQKAPKILDVVQSLIDTKKGLFVLSGSSARKLKRGAANLLAGRAYTFNLFPLTYLELQSSFDLNLHLRFGGLPHVWNTDSDSERIMFLRSYVSTYLKEEIAEEQHVRNLEPFAKFLQVAAQMSGYLINYSKIASDVGVSDQTVKSYFQILEETLLGFTLPAYNHSVRKSLGKTPKFYLFDTGILRALKRTVDQPFDMNHYCYGLYFEHFIIQQIMRIANYLQKDYHYSFLRHSEKEEIDLVMERPGKKDIFIEIKSTEKITETHIKGVRSLSEEILDGEFYLLSNDPSPKAFGKIKCLHWEEGIKKIAIES